MPQPVATGELKRRILVGSALYGVFFGLMPPYVMMIVVLATWGMPPLEGPDEQAFRVVYLVRLAIGNVIGLSVGALTAAWAVNFGLNVAGKATYLRGAIGGALLGCPVGAITAGSTPLVLLLSSSNVEWAKIMIQRGLAAGALMGLTNGMAAGLVIVYIVRRADRLSSLPDGSPAQGA